MKLQSHKRKNPFIRLIIFFFTSYLVISLNIFKDLRGFAAAAAVYFKKDFRKVGSPRT